jgi:hypothetical protein
VSPEMQKPCAVICWVLNEGRMCNVQEAWTFDSFRVWTPSKFQVRLIQHLSVQILSLPTVSGCTGSSVIGELCVNPFRPRMLNQATNGAMAAHRIKLPAGQVPAREATTATFHRIVKSIQAPELLALRHLDEQKVQAVAANWTMGDMR